VLQAGFRRAWLGGWWPGAALLFVRSDYLTKTFFGSLHAAAGGEHSFDRVSTPAIFLRSSVTISIMTADNDVSPIAEMGSGMSRVVEKAR
jgi:hypothetical protein